MHCPPTLNLLTREEEEKAINLARVDRKKRLMNEKEQDEYRAPKRIKCDPKVAPNENQDHDNTYNKDTELEKALIVTMIKKSKTNDDIRKFLWG